jgi:hypothetical protein
MVHHHDHSAPSSAESRLSPSFADFLDMALCSSCRGGGKNPIVPEFLHGNALSSWTFVNTSSAI